MSFLSRRLRRHRRRLSGVHGPGVDLRTRVGSVELPNPVMTAAGTAGHGAELAGYFDLSSLGAVVVKSISAAPHAGNPPPRLYQTPGGMLNSVGLQGPGIEAWLERDLPALAACGARVVVSVWGLTVDDYAKAAAMLAEAPEQVVAVEVNLSCPNLEGGRHLFAHSATATAEAMAATEACGRPRWAKLSPNTSDMAVVAGAALQAGAEALTLVNTVMGMAIDPARRQFRLGAGAGGLSGPAIHPVAVRAVHECRVAFPDTPIVGVGGVVDGESAVELMVAGAHAVQVGTATFAEPRAPVRVLEEVERWCRGHDVGRVVDLIGALQQ
ncbi:MAG: dihydroorotate dehydrogenase [Actinomycetota bacterium]|nr:dihydroorotate dehydrogenase [Actinomycetota bacterium]